MCQIEPGAEIRQQIIDDEHLRLLAIGHYVMGSLYILFSSMFIFHFAFMLVAALNPEGLFVLMATFVGFFILLGWTCGGLTIYAGRCIRRRSKRLFAVVMACLNLIGIPFGTLLGISTLLVLTRSSVKKSFERAS